MNNLLNFNSNITVKVPKSILGKSGFTIGETKISKLKGECNVTIFFKDDKEGLMKAKKFDRLAKNPNMKINLKFIKL